MLSEAYIKGMKIGWCVRPFINDSEIIPDHWSDSVEMAHLTDYIDGEVTRPAVMNAIEQVKKLKQPPDRDWDDNVRGLLAGCYFGSPDLKRNIKRAEAAEFVWNDDIEGNYGYYHEVCDEVSNGLWD